VITVKPKIEYDCDVIIAGAGPAGSGLAYHLASTEIKVIVVEAKKFPRDKVCGDGVSPVALAELHQMGITDTTNFEKANEINHVGLFIKDKKVVIKLDKPEVLPFHARIIPRLELDAWIYEAAKKAGADYLESHRIVDYDISSNAALVTVKNSEKEFQLKGRVLVGADGSNSTIARKMHKGKPSKDFQLLGQRAYYKNVNGPRDRVDIYFSEENFPGIFWLFPKGSGGANIGIAQVSRTLPGSSSNVKESLLNHIKTNPDIQERIGNGKPDDKMRGWPITFFNPDNSITDNRLLLVGEAAGLINPLSGDGIQYALLSARWASQTLETCLKSNDFSKTALNIYRKKVISEIGYDFALSNLLVQFPRNKTFSRAWMKILSVMISRAKKDHAYASTIAGIFEGTYPSYDALTLPFIIKSLEEGGIEAVNVLSDPSSMVESSTTVLQDLLRISEDLYSDPVVHGKWAVQTASKTLSVAGYLASSLLSRDNL
jgi:geranylgeranyl reductase family protein